MTEIIVLETTANGGGLITRNVAFWFPVAAGQEAPLDAGGSVWKGATQAEIDAIRAGTVIEESRNFMFPNSLTDAQWQLFLQRAYADRLAHLTASPAKGSSYGLIYDGTTWAKV